MARSAEKKMTALARWRAVYEDRISFRERPKLASECNSLRDANMFRRHILNEITRKITQIQNSSLGEFKLRDLNDEINRLFREKGHWEDRILELGGTDHKKNSFVMMEKEGRSLPGNWGYRYFGAAKDLPGVRELFQNDGDGMIKKVRVDLTDAYYGNQDEADGVLLPIETVSEKEFRQQLFKRWDRKRKIKDEGEKESGEQPHNQFDDNESDIYETGENPADTERDNLYDDLRQQLMGDVNPESVTDLECRAKRFKNIKVPSQSEIEKAVVKLKKDKILKNYMSDDLIADMVNSGTLLGMETAVVEPATEPEVETNDVNTDE